MSGKSDATRAREVVDQLTDSSLEMMKRIEQLARLIDDYDLYVFEALPITYQTSDRVRGLRERKRALLGEEATDGQLASEES